MEILTRKDLVNNEDTRPRSIAMGEKTRKVVATRNGDRMVSTQGKDNGFNTLSNIKELKSPLRQTSNGIDAKNAVELCQKAYNGVPIFKNTIEIITEFSNSPIHFRGDDKESIKFFTDWYKAINQYDVAEQFFRELNRSSNVYMYRMNYQFKGSDIAKGESKKLIGKEIPIRYAFLDPSAIRCDGGSSFFDTTYSKVLNKYELSRLRKPVTAQDKRLLSTFSPEEQKKIRSGHGDISMSLDEEKLIPVFHKKQDYEAMATPIYYPVLFDIDLKLQFKKADLAIAKTTDYLILLMTMGAPEKDGGTDPLLLNEMQGLFENESVGRVIVADYTTEGKFLIPEIDKILGKGKYEAVNKDIAQGMMNIFFDEDQKFSNSIIKIRVFLERLEEGRRIFRDKFLVPEMKRIAEIVGLKEVPEPVFEEVSLEDETQLIKTYTRLAEIGFLTPEEFFEATESGILPTGDESRKSQQTYKKDRDKGYYSPVIGGGSTTEAGRPEGTKSPNKRTPVKKTADTNVSVKKSERTSSAYKFTKIKEVHEEIGQLIPEVEAAFKKQFGLKRLSKKRKEEAFGFVESIVTSEPMKDWKKKINAYVSGKKFDDPNDEILEIAEQHEISYFQAAILFHGQD